MEEDDGPRRKPRLSVNRIILFGVLPLLLAVSAGAGVYFSGILDSLFSGAGSHDEAAGPNYYYDLDEMLVSLTGRRSEESRVGKEWGSTCRVGGQAVQEKQT